MLPLQQFGHSADGVKLLAEQTDLVPCLVALLKKLPGTGVSLAACDNSVATLAGVCHMLSIVARSYQPMT